MAVIATAHLLPAQIPAHATQLNPNSGFSSPVLVQTDDVVHVMGKEAFGTPYCRSTDGGRTWDIVDQPLGQITSQDIAHDGDLMVISGVSGGGIGVGGPAVIVSADLGATWSPVQLVSTWTGAQFYVQTSVHVSGQTVLLVWTEILTGSIWMRRSTDGGQSFPGPDLLVAQTPPPPFTSDPMDMHVVSGGNNLHVFWRSRNASGYMGQMQTTSDAGLTWLPSPRPTIAPAFQGKTVVEANATTLFLSQDGSALHRSDDGGITWNAVAGLPASTVKDVCVHDNTVVVVGLVDQAPLPITWTIQVSTDGGATWPNPAFLAASAAGYSADAQIDGDNLYVDFAHAAQPAWSLLASSRDAGLSWQSMEAEVVGFSASPRRNIHVRRVPNQLSPSQLFAYVGLGFSVTGTGTAGAGQLRPQLTMQGLPALGLTPDFMIDGAVGGALGVVGISWWQPQATALAGGTLWLQGPLLTNTFQTSGAIGAAGLGSAAVPFAVPNQPAFVGARLTCQAVVLDPAAQANLALSNAIEMWTR